jgi:hypothetical protein
MDYCAVRLVIEQQLWTLTSRHSSLATRLMMLIGGERLAFLATQEDCRAASREIAQARLSLFEHKREHGC